MQTKILINAQEGIIEVEGETSFVREVYTDFKDLIIPLMENTFAMEQDESKLASCEPSPKPKTRKKTGTKKVAKSEGVPGVNPDNPSLDKQLDTSGVREFYAQYEPKNHPEKILIFMRFLKDKVGIDSPNTDQVYTCYSAVGEKPAAAFAQSFRDTSSKKFGFIEYKSANDVTLTFIGNRHFDHDLKKKGVE